jgi:hypothetical protein
MPRYSITVLAERTVSQEFEITAETREEAEEMALAEARDDIYGWDDCEALNDYRVGSVEEEAPEEDEEVDE